MTTPAALAAGTGSGTVTHSAGALTANRLVIGNGTDDLNVLSSAGTTGQTLVAGSPPSFKTNPWVNARDYGTVGDGSTDDTVALQAALDATVDGAVLFLPPGRYKITSGLTIANVITIQGAGAGSYNTDIFGSTTWASRVWEHGSVIETAMTSGSVFTFAPSHVRPLNLKDFVIKGLGDNTRTTVGVTYAASRSVWCNVTLLNLKTGMINTAESDDNLFQNVVVNGCDVGMYLDTNANQNTLVQFNAMTCNTGLKMVNCQKNAILSGAVQGCKTWGLDIYASETDANSIYFENATATGGAIYVRTGDGNRFIGMHLGAATDNVTVDTNTNTILVTKYSAGTVTFSALTHRNVLDGNMTGTFSDLGNGNWHKEYIEGIGERWTFSGGVGGGMSFLGGTPMALSLTTAGGLACAFSVRDDLGEARLIDTTNNFPWIRFEPNAAGGKIGFYAQGAVSRQLLATGTGKTVDNVITALQNLGLVRQS